MARGHAWLNHPNESSASVSHMPNAQAVKQFATNLLQEVEYEAAFAGELPPAPAAAGDDGAGTGAGWAGGAGGGAATH
jgi:hypothetical protein